MLANYLLVSMVSQKKCTIELPFRFSFIRASTLVVLNRYIVNFSTTKYQNVSYNGGAKVILFSFTATVHNYFWLCTIAKKKRKTFLLCIHIAFDYFTHFYSFFYSYFSSSTFTLLLFVRSHFIYSLFFFFFFILHSHCYILFVHSHCYCSLILIFSFLFLYIVFLFVRSHCYCSKYIILL